MDLGIKGKKVLITGSTSGIGFACAEIFIQEGAEVIINGRSNETIEHSIQILKKSYPQSIIKGICADFRNKIQIDQLINNLPQADILINNVGIYTSESFEQTSDETWMDMFNVNVMSAVRLSRAYLPEMLRKNWGRIIFVSSECASIIPADMIAYSTTKAALHAVSRGLAQICVSSNVTVNTVMPGSTLTEGAVNFINEMAMKNGISFKEAESNFFKNVRTSSIVQRFLLPNEIAQSIVYLASNMASATNGSVVKLDGGSVGGIF